MRLLLLGLILSACSPGSSSEEGAAAQQGKAPRPDFVGRAACAECHELQHQLYQGSHHDLAMDLATDETVLGDFGDATHDHFGVKTTFSRDGDKYIVETDGPDGAPTRYEVAYVFGFEPLQQYLIAFPGGRVQCLGVAWDSRPEADGGQRWYHLYEEPIP
ncbi:MAG: cytochrome C, partial [Planctomycetota bacterium]|nr:cytochrome C [Planctomycetota bacterium]